MHVRKNRELLPLRHYALIEKIEYCVVVFVHEMLRRNIVLILGLFEICPQTVARPRFDGVESGRVDRNVRVDIDGFSAVSEEN